MLRSMSVRGAEVQVVDAGSLVVLDIQAEHWNTAGRLVRDHAFIGCTLAEARHLRLLLSQAIKAARSTSDGAPQ